MIKLRVWEYVNIILCLYVITATLRRAVWRATSTMWLQMPAIRLYYNEVMTPVIISYTVGVIVGLWFQRTWGHSLALSWNCLLMFMNVGLPVIMTVWFARDIGEALYVIKHLGAESVFISLASLVCTVLLWVDKSQVQMGV